MENKKTLREWLNEHTECGFEKITCADGYGDNIVMYEGYFNDHMYAVCRDECGFFWFANGTESEGFETTEEFISRFEEDPTIRHLICGE